MKLSLDLSLNNYKGFAFCLFVLKSECLTCFSFAFTSAADVIWPFAFPDFPINKFGGLRGRFLVAVANNA
jgi:hypothetical protein